MGFWVNLVRNSGLNFVVANNLNFNTPQFSHSSSNILMPCWVQSGGIDSSWYSCSSLSFQRITRPTSHWVFLPCPIPPLIVDCCCFLFSISFMEKAGKFSFVLIQHRLKEALYVWQFSALLSLPLMATKPCLVSVVVLGWKFPPSPQKWQISTCHK